jgi:hypothetical protein
MPRRSWRASRFGFPHPAATIDSLCPQCVAGSIAGARRAGDEMPTIGANTLEGHDGARGDARGGQLRFALLTQNLNRCLHDGRDAGD